MTVAMRVLAQDPTPETIHNPTRVEGIDGWVNRAASSIIALGGDPNKVWTPQLRGYLEMITPDRNLPELTNQWRRWNFANVWEGLKATLVKGAFAHNYIIGALLTRRLNENGDGMEPVSLASLKLVTDVGVNAIVDAFDAGVGFTLNGFNFHGIGLGTTGAAVGDTDVETELTTQYIVNSTRATGAQTQPSVNVYQSLATNTVDATVAITEQGLLTSATVGSGTLFDRHTFSAINLVSGNTLETTYQGTFAAGG